VNAGDADAAVALAAADVEVGGPRGSDRGRDRLREWVGGAGIRLEVLRTFARDGLAVVEQDATWPAPEAGEAAPPQRVASVFATGGGLIQAILRHPDLDAALAAAGLDRSDAAD
jgi:hypothetical protein